MLRALHHDQPQSFAFTPDNERWADAQITKYPPGRQASAAVQLLWRAQEQEGWLTRPAIEYVAKKLEMAPIRVLEVATFYYMFHLHPVGRIAHVQVCGTTSCMLCGSEDLMDVCRETIAAEPFALSADGNFSWEEVECLGACANAPMVQIGKDYYEDLTAESFRAVLDAFARGEIPAPGSQAGRFASEPAGGLTSLEVPPEERLAHNASVARALELGDTNKRITGSEVEIITPWLGEAERPSEDGKRPREEWPEPGGERPPDETGTTKEEAPETKRGRPPTGGGAVTPAEPTLMEAPEGGAPDDLTRIRGIGPALAEGLRAKGIFHFRQIAAWGDAEVAWVDANLAGAHGRASRDDWVGQAKAVLRDGEGATGGRRT